MAFATASLRKFIPRLIKELTNNHNQFEAIHQNETILERIGRFIRLCLFFCLAHRSEQNHAQIDSNLDQLFTSRSWLVHWQVFFDAIGPRIFNYLAWPLLCARLINFTLAIGSHYCAKFLTLHDRPSGFISIGKSPTTKFFDLCAYAITGLIHFCIKVLRAIACLGIFVGHYLAKIGDYLLIPFHARAVSHPRSFWLTAIAAFTFGTVLLIEPSFNNLLADKIGYITQSWQEIVLWALPLLCSATLTVATAATVAASSILFCTPASWQAYCKKVESTCLNRAKIWFKIDTTIEPFAGVIISPTATGVNAIIRGSDATRIERALQAMSPMSNAEANSTSPRLELPTLNNEPPACNADLTTLPGQLPKPASPARSNQNDQPNLVGLGAPATTFASTPR